MSRKGREGARGGSSAAALLALLFPSSAADAAADPAIQPRPERSRAAPFAWSLLLIFEGKRMSERETERDHRL